MFTCPGRLDGRIQGQQIGLLGQIINHLNNVVDAVSPLAQSVNDLAGRLYGPIDSTQPVNGFFHGSDALVHLFARTLGNIEQHLRGVSHALD